MTMRENLPTMSTPLVQWDSRLTVAVIILFVFALTRVVTTLRSTAAISTKGEHKKPPIVPYSVPGVGNLFAFAFNTEAFLSGIIKKYGSELPVRIRVANRKIHFISGAENVQALFRGSRHLTTAPTSILILENAFGSPPESRPVMQKDDTGLLKEPLPGSNPVEPHNRLFYLDHKLLHRNLKGNALDTLAVKFMENLDVELSSLDIGTDEWVDVPDIYRIIKDTVFKASTTAICGPHLFRLNPDFTSDFWFFDSKLPGLFKNLPRWLIPKSYRIRDKLTACILQWHKYAAEHADAADPDLEDVEYEEYFGARIMRERQTLHAAIDGYTEQAAAASDLGMIWGSNANIIPLIGWQMLDVLFRPELLAKVRARINVCSDSTRRGAEALNMPKLLADPLLQSIYSEELRVRNGLIVQRAPVIDNFKIGSWTFPKGQMITTSSWHEQRDRSVWNEGPVNGEFHSVDDFWAERFLVYSNNPDSGPRKPAKPSTPNTVYEKLDEHPKFVTETVNGSYIPYGGGQTMCPGRFYAKQEAIGALAMFLTMFDIELSSNEKIPGPNMEYFPFGVLPPNGKVAARIRRRNLE